MKKTSDRAPKKSKAAATTEGEKAAPPAKKQQTLDAPGMERKRIPQVEAAANKLRETRTERMELQKLEATQQDELVEKMREHGVRLYKFDGEDDELIVELKDKTKVQVRKATTAKSEDE
jgi:hypothetical protein